MTGRVIHHARKRSREIPRRNMDVKEFDLLYNSASPLFRGSDLTNTIQHLLEEEKVPHSIKPKTGKHKEYFAVQQYRTKLTGDKTQSSAKNLITSTSLEEFTAKWYRTKLADDKTQTSVKNQSTSTSLEEFAAKKSWTKLTLDKTQPTAKYQHTSTSCNGVPQSGLATNKIKQPLCIKYKNSKTVCSMENGYIPNLSSVPVSSDFMRKKHYTFPHAAKTLCSRSPCKDEHAQYTGNGKISSKTNKTLENWLQAENAPEKQEVKLCSIDKNVDLLFSNGEHHLGKNSSLHRPGLLKESRFGPPNRDELQSNSVIQCASAYSLKTCERQEIQHFGNNSDAVCEVSVGEVHKQNKTHLSLPYTEDSQKTYSGDCHDQRNYFPEKNGTATCEVFPSMPRRNSLCSNDTQSSASQDCVQYQVDESLKEKDQALFRNEASEPDVRKDGAHDNQSDVITPVEIGCFDTEGILSMVGTLVEANQHFKEFPRTHEPEKQTLLQKQNHYLEKKKANEGSACTKPEDKEEIRSLVLEHSVKYIEMRIAESVRFAKKIPGFLELPLEDQANLIRESRTESAIVGGMRGINAEKGVFSTRQGAFFSMEDMKLVFDETLLTEKMLLSKKIANLNLSLEEEAILRALTITATDRCKLLRRDMAEDIQNKLMSCLLHVVSKRGSEPVSKRGSEPVSKRGPEQVSKRGSFSVSKRLCALFDVLMSCRYVTEVDLKQVKKIFLEWPSFSNYKLAEEFL